jgi:RNA recognition motif-containing protein
MEKARNFDVALSGKFVGSQTQAASSFASSARSFLCSSSSRQCHYSKEEPHMGSKIYVGGLPYSATEQQLSDLFGAHGAVASARIITDKFTGQSRGFGFVEMSSDSEAQAAITALNGSEMGGRTLTVNEARPQEPRSGGGGRGGFGGGRSGGAKRDRW